MAGGNGRDAATVNQRPLHHPRKNFSRFDFGQQAGERSFRAARGEFAGGGEKMFRRAANLFRQPAPVKAVNGFCRDDFV